MPNGKPGDHPYTDIIHHGSSEYGEPVDGLVKELSKLPGFSNVRGEVLDLLWQNSPIGAVEPEKNKEFVLGQLQSILQRLTG